jgi:hypothetical protein
MTDARWRMQPVDPRRFAHALHGFASGLLRHESSLAPPMNAVTRGCCHWRGHRGADPPSGRNGAGDLAAGAAGKSY